MELSRENDYDTDSQDDEKTLKFFNKPKNLKPPIPKESESEKSR